LFPNRSWARAENLAVNHGDTRRSLRPTRSNVSGSQP
jgi:hypothetical protein